MALELAALGVEALRAEHHGIPLSEAALDDTNFALLARLHRGVRDMLTMELPAELVAFFQRLTQVKRSPLADELMMSLGQAVASEDGSPAERGALRILLFEMVRMGMLLEDLLEQREAWEQAVALGESPEDAAGARSFLASYIEPEDVDEIAESQVDRWRAIPERLADVRPLPVLLAAAFSDVSLYGAAIQRGLAELDGQIHQELAARARAEAVLNRCDTSDALLIRQFDPEGFGEQEVSVELLHKRHQLVFGDVQPESLQRRSTRLKRDLESRKKTGSDLERKKPAFVDLIAKARKEKA
jgi:hypothetical protein